MKTTLIRTIFFFIGVVIGWVWFSPDPIEQNTANTEKITKAMDTCSVTIEELTGSLDTCERNLTVTQNDSYVIIDAAVTAQENTVKVLALLDRCINAIK